jgi:hypothetical protein
MIMGFTPVVRFATELSKLRRALGKHSRYVTECDFRDLMEHFTE